MILKVFLLLAGLAMANAAALVADDTATTTSECLFQDEIWGSVDGSKFYFCYKNVAIEQSCPEDTFFVKTPEMSGCVPVDIAPANCVYNTDPGPCTGDNLTQPQTSKNSNSFFLCTQENATPIELQCAEGKAFVKQDGYLGCFPWEQWRTIRGCPQSGTTSS